MSASVDGRPLELTTFEFGLLQILMLNAGKVLSPSTLADHLYDESAERERNVVPHFVWRVRRKLDPEDRIKPIVNIYGSGYLFAVPRGRAK